MSEIICLDLDVDWIDGVEEPGEIFWTDNGWSLVDRPVAAAVHRYGIVGGLDSQGCSLLPHALAGQQAPDTDECGPVALLAHRVGAIRLFDVEAIAA